MPPIGDPKRHEDSSAYRMGAVRECFEESGILLARKVPNSTQRLFSLTEKEREEGRYAIHNGTTTFLEWLESIGAFPALGTLKPFTRWLTPANVHRRYSTQMYLYILPTRLPPDLPNSLPVPTSDGGIEHTTAEFRPVSEWLSRYKANEIILFPPQFFLLSILAAFLDPVPDPEDFKTLITQRERLMDFLTTQEDGEPCWLEKCISPYPMFKDGKRVFMALDQAGRELQGTGRGGDGKRVISWVFEDGRHRGMEVRWKEDVIKERKEREATSVHKHSREQSGKEVARRDREGKEKL